MRVRRDSTQRRGTQEMTEFHNFIETLELVDVPLIGTNYTWKNKQINK